MKKIIALFALLMLVSCAKTIEQQQEEWTVCANEAVAKGHKKYEDLGEEKAQLKFFEDICKQYNIKEDQCMVAIIQAHMEGNLGKVVNAYNYDAFAQPECGDFPEDESKKSKD